jgi:hypothetical protein
MDKYKLNNQAIVEAVERVMKKKVGFHLILKKTSSFILNWFFLSVIFLVTLY